jgi:hypothetical protein
MVYHVQRLIPTLADATSTQLKNIRIQGGRALARATIMILPMTKITLVPNELGNFT